MKYIFIDEVRGDIFSQEFETESEAIAQADGEWHLMANCDKKKRNSFYVLESINPDEDAVNHFDGNVIKSWI